MPLNLDYVIASYAIWLGTFIVYIFSLKKKLYQQQKLSEPHSLEGSEKPQKALHEAAI